MIIVFLSSDSFVVRSHHVLKGRFYLVNHYSLFVQGLRAIETFVLAAQLVCLESDLVICWILLTLIRHKVLKVGRHGDLLLHSGFAVTDHVSFQFILRLLASIT